MRSNSSRGERGVSTPRGTLQPPNVHRPGFTLIEMLVVIAIIGILASMIVAASMRVIGMQAQKNTYLEIQKIDDAINAKWKAVTELANNEQSVNVYPAISGTTVISFQQWAGLPPVMGLSGGDIRVARLVYIQLRLKQQFPETISEAKSSPGLGLAPEPFYQQMLQVGVPANEQQGVCLWLALKNSSNGASFNQDILTPQETQPIKGTPVFCLVDAWRQPLQFQRMPYAAYTKTPQGQLFLTSPVQLDLDPRANPRYAQFYFFPVVGSGGAPKLKPPQPIWSYNNLTIGGPIGG